MNMSVETFGDKRVENNIKKMKRITVSSKRQISIPKEFYDAIGLSNEVTIELLNNRLIIRPVKEDSDDFSEEILSDLIDEGYKGDELKNAFSERRAMLSSAVDHLIEEARSSKSYDSFEDMLEDTDPEDNED